jgi:PBP1b-binding outer membrane lipoprotein LpoB
MERVKCIGSEHETMQHNVIMFSMKQTNIDWENRTSRFSDLLEFMSQGDFNEVDISSITNVLENLEMFGMNPNAMSNMFSNFYQVE